MLVRSKSRPSRCEAFTLVEIMIAVAIIALLATLAIPSFGRARDNARLNTIYRNLRTIDSAKETWAMEKNLPTGAAVNDISEFADYIRGGVVQDVVRETYVPNAVGTPPSASLPSGVRLGPYAGGASIPAP